MKIGVSAQIFWNYIKLDIPDVITHAVDTLGFECVEILCENPVFRNWGTYNAEKIRKDIRETLETLDVEISLHAPHHDMNIATWDIGMGKEVIRNLEECMVTADYLNSNIIVVHPGFVASRKFSKKKTFDLMIKNLKKVTRLAEDLDITICMENLASKSKAIGVHTGEIKNILESVNSDNFKITLDIAHANTTGIGPEQFIEQLRDDIRHVHISDNMGVDAHLPIGVGSIDFEGVLKALHPYDGFLIIEGWIPHNQDHFLRWDKSQLEGIIKEIKGTGTKDKGVRAKETQARVKTDKVAPPPRPSKKVKKK